MDMRLMQHVVKLIADEIRGRSFAADDKQGALDRAEGIISALDAAGISMVRHAHDYPA